MLSHECTDQLRSDASKIVARERQATMPVINMVRFFIIIQPTLRLRLKLKARFQFVALQPVVMLSVFLPSGRGLPTEDLSSSTNS